MKEYDFSLEACIDEAVFEYSECMANPFEELGRAIIRAEQDPLFNKTMIEAWKEVIRMSELKWDDKLDGTK